MAELKNIRIAVSGIYDYALEEIPTLRIPMPGHGAPDWVEEKRLYQVYRPPFVLAAACDKFKMLPLTHHHPKVPVDGQNFRDLALGYTGENPTVDYVKEKNEVGIRSTLMMYDDEALQAYENGEIQLSPGYVAVFEWQKGTSPDGQPYDIVMKEITDVNHVALLPKGRGGEYAVVMDKAPEQRTVFDYIRNRREVLDYGTIFDLVKYEVQDVKYEDGHVSHRKNGDYVKRGGEWKLIAEAEKSEGKKETVSFKKGLKKTSDISDYMATRLESMGYEVERKHSGLSNSEYITIKNAGELFGKADTDDVEIRISNHDLPPSYDRQYKGDFDVRSEDVPRNGTNGDASNYEDILASLAKKKGIDTPEYDAKLKEREQERKEIANKYAEKITAQENAEKGREWAVEYAKKNLPYEYKQVQELYSKADTVTGDKRKQLRKQANKILNEIYARYSD